MNKYILLITLLLTVSLLSWISDVRDEGNPLIVYSITNNNVNKTKVIASSFRKNNSLSIMASHYNSIIIQNYLYEVALNNLNDEILVFNTSTNSLKKISLNKIPKIPIEHLYFHNTDSIFLFFNREFIFNNQNKTSKDNKFDFILIDSNGNVINSYNLDSVPHIYKGQNSPMIFQTPKVIKETQIINGDLLISFSIYLPTTSDSSFINYSPKLLCKYNLKNKSLKMLNIKFPSQDIGKVYSKGVQTNYMNFQTNNRSNIFYSFPYSPTIYEFDVKLNKVVNKIEFQTCPFDNQEIKENTDENLNNTTSKFNPPIYSKAYNIYLRSIEVKGYKNFDRFSVVQVLDTNLNLLGYVFPDTHNNSIYVFGDSICRYNKEDRLSYYVSFGNKALMNINDIELEFLYRYKMETFKEKDIVVNETKNIKSRFSNYLNILGIPDSSKIISLNTDVICSTSSSYLFNKFKNENEYLSENKIFMLIMGSEPSNANFLIQNYKVTDANNIINDSNLHYRNFLKDNELSYYYLIKFNSKDSLVLDSCNINSLIPKTEKFIKK
ncbi:MAG: hypothetical protein K9J13_09310 [Saprospiraceae bacterium]|nr:hypothetical protein [Saprospiraceae bacterium]